MIESAEKLAGPQRIVALTDLGSVATRARLEWMLDGGQALAAVPLAKRLIEQSDALFPSESPRRLDARQRLAETYVLAGQADNVAAVFKALAQPPFNAPNMELEFKARAIARKVEKLVTTHRYEEAEPLAQEWRDMFKDADPPNPFFLAFAELYLGDCLYSQARFEAALQKFKQTLPLFADSVGPEHVYITTSQYHIGLAAHALGHHRAALALYETVNRWYLKNVSARGSPSAMFARARLLADMGQPADALVALDRIDKNLLPMFLQSPGLEAWVSAERARMLLALGRADEAKLLLQTAVPAMTAVGMPKWQVARYQKLVH